MADRIQLKRSAVPDHVPESADLAVGELAINTADGRLFTKLADGSIVELAGGSVTSVAGLTGVVTTEQIKSAIRARTQARILSFL